MEQPSCLPIQPRSISPTYQQEPPQRTFSHNSKNNALLSIGKSCDHGYTAIFTAAYGIITIRTRIVLNGYRDTSNNLCRIPLKPHTPTTNDTSGYHGSNTKAKYYSIHALIDTKTVKDLIDTETVKDLINFIHACAFSPSIRTWRKAIKKGYFTTWPGLSDASLLRHLE